MLTINEISKTFDNIKALDNISLNIEQGKIWGLLGINGAGKSTLLKIIAGILKPDTGEIRLDDQILFDNPAVRQELFYLSDDVYYFPNATAESMAGFYGSVYSDFNIIRYRELYRQLGFDDIRKIRTFSKGMKRQIFILLALCSQTQYLLCDEIFDGLDPIVRNTIREMLLHEVKHRGLTLIMASHNLKELEDFCDYLGIIHKGGIVISKDIKRMRHSTYKFQCVYDEDKEDELREQLDIAALDQQGFLYTMLVRGEAEEIRQVIASSGAVRYEELPLTVEEIFIHEGEEADYDIQSILS